MVSTKNAKQNQLLAAMPEAVLATVQNHLIELLPSKDRLRLLKVCEPVELTLSEVLCESGEVTRHVYFPLQWFYFSRGHSYRKPRRGSRHGGP